MSKKRGDIYRAESAQDRTQHKRAAEQVARDNLNSGTRGDVQCNRIIHYRAPKTAGDKRHPLREGYVNVNVCSSGSLPYRTLSPMLIGPFEFYDCDRHGVVQRYIAQNIENWWQFAKVWSGDLNTDDSIKPEWFAIRDAGWADPKPHRRPRGKVNRDGPNPNIPMFSLWRNKRLSYEVARIKMYISYYTQFVEQLDAYKQLKQMVDNGTNVQIIGYDGRDFTTEGLTLKDCLDDGTKPYGHELVLTAMLRNERVWDE